MVIMSATKTLADVILSGLNNELSYMTADEQAAALDRFEYLQSCDSDEIPDAAGFIALAVARPTGITI